MAVITSALEIDSYEPIEPARLVCTSSLRTSCDIVFGTALGKKESLKAFRVSFGSRTGEPLFFYQRRWALVSGRISESSYRTEEVAVKVIGAELLPALSFPFPQTPLIVRFVKGIRFGVLY